MGGSVYMQHMAIVREVRSSRVSVIGSCRGIRIQECVGMARPHEEPRQCRSSTYAHTKPVFIQVYCLDPWQARPIDALSPMGQFAKHFKAITTSGYARTRPGDFYCEFRQRRKPSGSCRPPSCESSQTTRASPCQPAPRHAPYCVTWCPSHWAKAKTLEVLSDRVRRGSGDGADFGYDDIMELGGVAVFSDQNDRQDLNKCQQKFDKEEGDLASKARGIFEQAGAGAEGRWLIIVVASLVLPECSLEQVSLEPVCPPRGGGGHQQGLHLE